MNENQYILSIDQGTSSTKCLIFDAQGAAIAKGSEPLQTQYLADGFVEQDPEAIYGNVLAAVENCLNDFEQKGHSRSELACVGISNQRETFIIWDQDGNPLYPAVVWQCKRSVLVCEQLKRQGMLHGIQQKTGLTIDPYFSATKLIWLFQHNATVRGAIQQGTAFFGTVDTWLLYKLTGGKSYATDYTNASRTLLFNLHTLQWDDTLIAAYGLTGIQLPAVHASSFHFGDTTVGGLLTQPIGITAMIGDSHAAAFGEGCFYAGTAKATLGTGCSILMNIGSKPLASKNGIVTTICWSTPDRIDYALEGVIVSCGATLEWLKNELGLFESSTETAAMAKAVDSNGGVYLIPAFSGLGSPHWQMDRKASISGLSFESTKNHIVRAALESIPYQIMDVLFAMEKDTGIPLLNLMADGGITTNDFVMQFIADLLKKNVLCIGMPDVSALGAAYLAGLESGVFSDIESINQLNQQRIILKPNIENVAPKKGYEGWNAEINNAF